MLRKPRKDRDKVSKSHARAPKQEKELARRFGGQAVPGSGAGMMKGDVCVKGVARIEAKTTLKKSFSVTRAMLDKLDDAAFGAGEIPILVVEFLNAQGQPEREVALIDLGTLTDLIDAKKND